MLLYFQFLINGGSNRTWVRAEKTTTYTKRIHMGGPNPTWVWRQKHTEHERLDKSFPLNLNVGEWPLAQAAHTDIVRFESKITSIYVFMDSAFENVRANEYQWLWERSRLALRSTITFRRDSPVFQKLLLLCAMVSHIYTCAQSFLIWRLLSVERVEINDIRNENLSITVQVQNIWWKSKTASSNGIYYCGTVIYACFDT